MVPKWKLEAIAALTTEVEQLHKEHDAAEFALEQAQENSNNTARKWQTAEELLEKLRDHIRLTTPATEGGAA